MGSSEKKQRNIPKKRGGGETPYLHAPFPRLITKGEMSLRWCVALKGGTGVSQ